MDNDFIGRLVGLDQQEAGIINMAGFLGTFYKELIGRGVPEALAQAMVRDWFILLVSKSLYPDNPINLPGMEQ